MLSVEEAVVSQEVQDATSDQPTKPKSPLKASRASDEGMGRVESRPAVDPFADSLLIHRTPTTSTPASTRTPQDYSSTPASTRTLTTSTRTPQDYSLLTSEDVQIEDDSEQIVSQSLLDQRIDAMHTRTTPQDLLRTLSRLTSPMDGQSPSPVARLSRSQSTPTNLASRPCLHSPLSAYSSRTTPSKLRDTPSPVPSTSKLRDTPSPVPSTGSAVGSSLYTLIHSRITQITQTTSTSPQDINQDITALTLDIHAYITQELSQTAADLSLMQTRNHELVELTQRVLNGDPDSDTDSIDLEESLDESAVIEGVRAAVDAMDSKDQELCVRGKRIEGLIAEGEDQADSLAEDLAELKGRLAMQQGLSGIGLSTAMDLGWDWKTPTIFVAVVVVYVFLTIHPDFVEWFALAKKE